jgi:hypothetical protein
VLEVKTAGPSTYPKFSKGDIPKDYKAQANAYMAALGITDTLFMVKNKATGNFEFVPYKFDKEMMERIFDRLGRITRFIRGESTELDREYSPDKNGYLPFDCNYCDYILNCWKNRNPRKLDKKVVIYKVEPEVFDIPEEIETLLEERS